MTASNELPGVGIFGTGKSSRTLIPLIRKKVNKFPADSKSKAIFFAGRVFQSKPYGDERRKRPRRWPRTSTFRSTQTGSTRFSSARTLTSSSSFVLPPITLKLPSKP